MGFECPHCSKGIDNVVKQDIMTERLKSQREALEGKIADAVNNVESAYKTKLTEMESNSAKIAGEFETYKQLTTRAESLRQNGIGADKHSTFFLLYDSSQAGKVNGDAVSFDDWLASDALSHPVLGSHFPTPATNASAEPAPQAPAPKPVASLPHLAGAVATPPDPARRRTPQEIAEYFRSDKYRSLSPEDRKAEQQRIREEIG